MTVFWQIGIGRFENIPPTFATSKINEFITPNFYAYDTQNFTLKSTRPHGYPTFSLHSLFAKLPESQVVTDGTQQRVVSYSLQKDKPLGTHTLEVYLSDDRKTKLSVTYPSTAKLGKKAPAATSSRVYKPTRNTPSSSS